MGQEAGVLQPQSALQALVAAEKARAERDGSGAAMVVLERSQRVRAGQLLPRLRSTDEVVQCGPDRIALLLRDTGRKGAEAFVAKLEPGLSNLEFTVLEVEGPFLASLRSARRAAQRDPGRVQQDFETGARDPGSISVSCEPAGLLTLFSRELPPWKRAGDVLLSLLGLVLLSPVLLLVGLAVWATSPGPVFFRQQRTGRNLRRFGMFKFRTMRIGAEAQQGGLRHANQMTGPLFKMERDPRLTLIGAFLRRSSLDELPQLVNVLRGEMTLIGPRALTPGPARYERWQLARFEHTPGLACTWQATRRGDTDFDEWMRTDLRYVARGDSLRGDLRLLRDTLWAVLTRSGSR